MKTRIALITEAKRIRAEIEQMFTDATHWSSFVRKSGEKLIDPDPDGKMRQITYSIDRMLAAEKQIDTTPKP
jgi:hypothetical protein